MSDETVGTLANQSEQRSAPPPYVSKSYHYLRLGMVAMVFLLATSIVLEILAVPESCVQDSISAYYYTPVQFIFVASWVTIGLCMIVLKGSNDWEDAFLNVAGLLAPVVAFVPTTRPEGCSSAPALQAAELQDSAKNVQNNIGAYLILGFVVLVWVWVAWYRLKKPVEQGKPVAQGKLQVLYALVPITALYLVAVVIFKGFNDLFLDKAHGVAASLMVVFIVGVVAQNSIQSGRESEAYLAKKDALRKQKDDKNLNLSYFWQRYFFVNRYSVIAWLMIISAVGLIVAGLVFGWNHWILAIEVAEIALFATFWLIQTFDPERSKVPLGDRAEDPTAGVRKDFVLRSTS